MDRLQCALVGNTIGGTPEARRDLDGCIAPFLRDAQERGGLASDAANIRCDALGLRVDIDTDASAWMIERAQRGEDTGLGPRATGGMDDVSRRKLELAALIEEFQPHL